MFPCDCQAYIFFFDDFKRRSDVLQHEDTNASLTPQKDEGLYLTERG